MIWLLNILQNNTKWQEAATRRDRREWRQQITSYGDHEPIANIALDFFEHAKPWTISDCVSRNQADSLKK